MITTKNNKIYISNSNIEILPITRKANREEITIEGVKPDYYKINLYNFANNQFKTLPQVKQYLKSEIAIVEMLQLINEGDIYIDTAKRETEKYKMLNAELLTYKQYKYISKLPNKQLNKLHKWLHKVNN